MTTRRKEVKQALSAAIEAQPVDAALLQMSFVRRRGTLRYQRKCLDLGQVAEFCFDMSPRYEPRAVADVLPQTEVCSEKVVPVIRDMTSRHPLANVFDSPMLFRQQIRNLAPLAAREDHWYVYDQDRVCECADRLSRFALSWCTPFLDEYSSLADLVEGYEQADERLPNDRRFRLYMSACYVVLDRPEQAMQNLDRFFGKPGPRREYAQAFDYLSTLLSQEAGGGGTGQCGRPDA